MILANNQSNPLRRRVEGGKVNKALPKFQTLEGLHTGRKSKGDKIKKAPLKSEAKKCVMSIINQYFIIMKTDFLID
jgi:hypothetical protein